MKGATQKTEAASGPRLEIRLSRPGCEAGGRLSGIVVFRLRKAVGIRSLTISISGRETPAGKSLKRSLRRTVSFFDREFLLSGTLGPRFTHERISQIWNALLARDHGRMLSPGEHVYPFSIQLPTSLPPSYNGNAGRIWYVVTARASFPVRMPMRAAAEVQMRTAPKQQRAAPVAVTYPNSSGSVHANEVSVNLQIAKRSARLGETVSGAFKVNNPRRALIREALIELENCEWVRLAGETEMSRNVAARHRALPDAGDAEVFAGEFELALPQDAPPSVEGTTISVIWLLRMKLDTDPPIEFKMPLFVYGGPPDKEPAHGAPNESVG